MQLIAISNKQHNQFPLTSSCKVLTGDVRYISVNTETAARGVVLRQCLTEQLGKEHALPHVSITNTIKTHSD